MKNLTNQLILTLVFVMSSLVVMSQEATPQEPTTGQKVMFYGLTAVGLVLLFLSYRQSKWGRKK